MSNPGNTIAVTVQQTLELPRLDAEQIGLLESTCAGGDRSIFKELLDLFQGEGRPHLQALSQAISDEDMAGITRHAHALAGSSANLGGKRLSALCRELEIATGTSATLEYAAVFEYIRVEYEALIWEIERLASGK